MDRNNRNRNPAVIVEEEARSRTDADAAARKSRDAETAERQRATEQQPAQQADPYRQMTEQTQKLDTERQDREKQDRERSRERDDRAKHEHEREQKKTDATDERARGEAEREQSQPVAVDLAPAAKIDVFELQKKTGADRDVAEGTSERVARGRDEERFRMHEQSRPPAVAEQRKTVLAAQLDLYAFRGATREQGLDDMRRRADEIRVTEPALFKQLQAEGHLEKPQPPQTRDEVVASLRGSADVKERQRELAQLLERQKSPLEQRLNAAFARTAQERERSRDDDDRGGPTHTR